MPSEALSLLRAMRSQTSSLKELLERAEYIASLDRELRQWTDEPWFDSIRLVNLRGDTAVLFASNAAALVPLRYRKDDLLAFLQERLHVTCSKLETRVKPIVHNRFRSPGV